MEIREYEDDDLEGGLRRTDPTALRIFASWIAQHDGLDPASGAVVDREFVLVDAPTMTARKLP